MYQRQKEETFAIHQYQNNGYNIVLDVKSGAVHVVDQAAYDVIRELGEHRMNFIHRRRLRSEEKGRFS